MRDAISAAALVCALAAPAAAQNVREPEGRSAPILREPVWMTKGFGLSERYLKDREGERKAGWYPVFKTNVTGDGWISAGSGVRRPLLREKAWVDGSAAVSWRGYKMAQGTVELVDLGVRGVSAGTQVLWHDLTQVQYFGAGPGRSRDLRSDYRIKFTDVVAFAAYRPTAPLTVEVRVGRLSPPRLSPSAGPFDRGYPDAALAFAEEPGFDQAQQPAFLHTHFSATADTRDHPGHPLEGGVYRAAVSMYSDRDEGRFSFRRYELEAAHFVPLAPGRWTLAFHGWTALSDTSTGRAIPAYMLPSLGGSTTLRSYSDYRFHDRHLLLASVESRWALFEHVDAAVFLDTGSVAPRVRRLTLNERSYGAGLRVHVQSATVARLDVAHGPEGWRVLMRLNEPFRLNRLSRRTAAVPFVP